MALMTAYFDESGKHLDHPVVTFCGVAGHQLNIERFNGAWRSLLDSYDMKSLHMKHVSDWRERVSSKVPIQSCENRIEVLKPFGACIADNLEIGLIQAWDVEGFKAITAAARMRIGNALDPYYTALIRAALEIAARAPESDDVEIVCDKDEQTQATALAHFEGIKNADDRVRDRIKSLRFADDENEPALQAADFVAFLARREARNRFFGETNAYDELYGHLLEIRGRSQMKWFAMYADKAVAARLSASLDPDPLKDDLGSA
jgi:hypothetical protein